MKYRRVGNWPLTLSEIAFGTGDNGGGMIYSTPRQQRALVEKALELGVTVFDTSPDYGKGLAEANLGRVLREIGPRDVQVITKVEIMPEDFGRIREKIQQSLNDSLLRLQRDHVDVFMLHNPCRSGRNPSMRQWTPLTPEDVIDQVLPAFLEAKALGKVRFLGAACETAETDAVRSILKTREFALIHVWFNLANPSAAYDVGGLPPGENYGGLLEAAEANGARAAVIRPLAGGALTDGMLKGGHAARDELSRGYFRDHPEAFDPEIERAKRLHFLARAGEQKLSEAAYRFILSNPTVATIIGGFSRHSHLDEAAHCSDLGPMSREELAAVEEVFAATRRA